MKKLFYVCAAAALIFSACSDNDDNAGNGGDNGSDEIRKIFVENSDIHGLPTSLKVDEVIFYIEYGTNNTSRDLVDTRWQNGFTMTLPATVGGTYLSSISSILNLPAEGTTGNVVISNSAAMVTTFSGFELLNDDDTVGYVYITGNNDNWEVYYMYADRDVNVKGTREQGSESKDTYDLELKKGWNRVARSVYTNTTNGVKTDYYDIKTELPSKLDWKYRTTRYFDPK